MPTPILFNEQLGSGIIPQSFLYFQGFRSSKLLNGCLVVFQVTYDCNNFQDSKSIFMISDFKIFPVMFLRQLKFGANSVQYLFYIYYKEKTPLCFNLSFLLLLSERGLSPESCSAIYHPRA